MIIVWEVSNSFIVRFITIERKPCYIAKEKSLFNPTDSVWKRLWFECCGAVVVTSQHRLLTNVVGLSSHYELSYGGVKFLYFTSNNN